MLMAVSDQDLKALGEKYFAVRDLLDQVPDVYVQSDTGMAHTYITQAMRAQYADRGKALSANFKRGMSDDEYANWNTEIDQAAAWARKHMSSSQPTAPSGSISFSTPQPTAASSSAAPQATSGPGVLDTIGNVFGGIAKSFQTPAPASFQMPGGGSGGSMTSGKPKSDYTVPILIAGGVLVLGVVAYAATRKR